MIVHTLGFPNPAQIFAKVAFASSETVFDVAALDEQ